MFLVLLFLFSVQIEFKALLGLCFFRGIDGHNLHLAEVI
jgi:hypothetical protein